MPGGRRSTRYKVRQELLAEQAAHGHRVLLSLDSQRPRAAADRAAASSKTGDLGPLMWEQLRGRAVRLFEVARQRLADNRRGVRR